MAEIKTLDLRSKRPERSEDGEARQMAADEAKKPTRKSARSRRSRPPEAPRQTAAKEAKTRSTAKGTRTRRPPKRAEPAKKPAPIIGITCTYRHLPSRAEHTQSYFYLYAPYVSAISEAGGVPVIIPVGMGGRYSNRVVALLDGLLLPGAGPDVDPNLYGDTPHAKLGPVDPREDRTEIELFNLAFNRNMPVLGICRGIQIINVALDGTLYQDIMSQVRMAMNHNPKFPPSEVSHRVDVERGSKLHKVLGETTLWVNSTHHQAVKLHGKGLVVSARASDGITEGLEHPTKKWIIGVQWHPELYWRRDKLMATLFKTFVEACKS